MFAEVTVPERWVPVGRLSFRPSGRPWKRE